MSKDYEDAIEIDAPAERVWAVLSDTASWTEWNPMVQWLEGSLTPGQKIKILVKPLAGGKGQQFTANLVAATPNRELAWKGSLPIPGLVDGHHYFRIEPLGDNRCRHIHGEVFSGLLVPLLAGRLDREVAHCYPELNRALKSRVESGAA